MQIYTFLGELTNKYHTFLGELTNKLHTFLGELAYNRYFCSQSDTPRTEQQTAN